MGSGPDLNARLLCSRREVAGRLLPGLLHDLGGAVMGIGLLASRLEAGDAVARMKAYLETLRGLLREARSLTGACEAAEPAVETDVVRLVTHSLNWVRTESRVRSVELEETQPPEPASAVVRPLLLQQAVLELVLEALEQCPPGGRVRAGVFEGARGVEIRIGPFAGGCGPVFELCGEIARLQGGELQFECDTVTLTIPKGGKK